MNCTDLVFEFESSRFKEIIGVKRVANGFEYAVITTNRSVFNLIPTAKALEMWAADLIDFLENLIVFEMPNNNADASSEIQLSRNIDTVGLPDEIIGICHFLSYLNALDPIDIFLLKIH